MPRRPSEERRELESVVKMRTTRAAPHPFPTALKMVRITLPPQVSVRSLSRLDRRERRAGRSRVAEAWWRDSGEILSQRETLLPCPRLRAVLVGGGLGRQMVLSPRRRQAARVGIALAARRRHLASVRDVVAACRTLSHRATLAFFGRRYSRHGIEPSGEPRAASSVSSAVARMRACPTASPYRTAARDASSSSCPRVRFRARSDRGMLL